jgi:hypothetical protein
MDHSFVDTRAYLERELAYTPDKAITKAIELKRGLGDTSIPGGFTKGIVYFRGLLAIDDFAERGGDIKRLYIGKIALEDLELAEKVPGLRAPLLLPSYLRSPKDTVERSPSSAKPSKEKAEQKDDGEE